MCITHKTCINSIDKNTWNSLYNTSRPFQCYCYVREDFVLQNNRKDLKIIQKLDRIRKLLCSCYL